MSDIHIWIPSKGRPNCPTANLLAKANVPFTVVVEPQDEEKYKCWPIVTLDRNDGGLVFVRNWIKDRAGTSWFWMLDDDIENFYHTKNKKNYRVTAHEAIRGAEPFFVENKTIGQASLEYQQYAWSAKKLVTHGGYCDVAVCIHAGRTKMCRFRPEVTLKEDRDFTLQVLANGYLTARVCKYSFSAPKNGSNAGGLQAEYAVDGREAAASLMMCKLWPGVCTPITKDDGRKDVKINWRFMSQLPSKSTKRTTR
jgi:hypothetical protein